MRIKVEGTIIEKTKPNKTNYSHEIQGAIFNKLSTQTSERLHKKEKFFRLLTFTNICIHKDLKTAHFYIAGEDNIINEFIQCVTFDNMIRIDDMVLIVRIQEIPQLPNRNDYTFKTKLVINVFDQEERKAKLCEDFNIVKERLIKNSLDKCNQLGVTGNINIEIINPQKQANQYKDGHIFSWKCGLKVTGDYDVINTIYNVGIGENTFVGNGFLWEC